MPRFISPVSQFFDDLGVPLSGGKIFFYQPGTLIAKNTFTTPALSTPNTNPVVLSDAGSPSTDIWLDGVYRVILKDSLNNTIWDKDPVGGDSGSLVAYSDWVNGVNYPIGEIVTASNGNYYVSIRNPNNGNDPVSSPVFWTQTRLTRLYNANESYATGDTVLDNGYYWRAKAPTLGVAPTLGSAFWEPAVDGIDELNLLTVPSNLAGPANLAKSRFYRLTGAGPYTLPSAATATVGEPIFLIKDPSVNPSIVAQATQKINVAGTQYDDILYNVNSSLTLTSDGAEWELN